MENTEQKASPKPAFNIKSANEDIKVNCINDGKRHKAEFGMSLLDFSAKWCPRVKDPRTGASLPVLAALVDHELKELSYKLSLSREVEFIGYSNPEGRRCYIRSLVFVLQKAIRELHPDKILMVEHSLPGGLYCELALDKMYEDGTRPTHFLTDADVDAIAERMREIVKADLPFIKGKILAEEAIPLFEGQGQTSKAQLLKSIGRFNWSVYSLGGVIDTFHGPLLPSTGLLTVFGLVPFGRGFCLQMPQMGNFQSLQGYHRQSKMSDALGEYRNWCTILGINGVGDLNTTISEGRVGTLINIAEALHERKYAQIADQIYQKRSNIKIVFIAGPSSSGKTSSSLRLAIQCKVLGLNPKVIELDNYFLNREQTPKDEFGNYDFESLYAMDLELLDNQLNALLRGERVEIPYFNFKKGEREWKGDMMKLEDNDILIMEGIHALNPEMVKGVDSTKIFRVYVSALTSLPLDENNNISTSENRLLRRMVRDARVRGITPEDTILRWDSVRRGETKNIFPFQENADAIFNSALIYELPLLKYHAEPLLLRIHPSSPAYTEARRLLKFLGYITALSPQEIQFIPPTSILREFIGGQSLKW